MRLPRAMFEFALLIKIGLCTGLLILEDIAGWAPAVLVITAGALS